MKNLTNDQIREIAESVAGGCSDHDANPILDSLGLDIWDLDEICAKVEQYKCPQCCWWGYPGEILEESSNGEAVCEDCLDEHSS